MSQGSNPFLAQVAQAAQAQGIDPRWAQAILMTENAPGDPSAVSSAGARGLMQVMPQNADGASLNDPSQNIARGVSILADNLKAYGGNKTLATAAYFGGPDQRLWGPKTHAYNQKVASNYNALGQQMQPTQSGTPDFDAYVAQATGQSGSAGRPAPGQGAGQSATPDFDAYVAKDTGTTPAAAAPSAPASVSNFRSGGRTASTIGPALAPVTSAIGRIGSAAVQGAQDAMGTAPLFPVVPGSGPGQFARQYLSNAASVPVDVLRGAGALMNGAQAAVAQTGAELGQPQLGRDIAALPEAFVGAAPEVGAAENALTRTAPADAAVARNALTSPAPRIEPTLPIPQARGAAEAAPAAPAPNSVGAAATPAELAPLTPREQAAAVNVDNANRLSKGPTPGDKNIYVPGSMPTKADVAGNAAVSLEENQHRYNLDPATSQRFSEHDQRNNDARVDYFDNLAGNDNTVRTAQEARSAQADQDLAQAWQNKAPVDAAPVVDTINSILSGPSGKLSAVRNALGQVVQNMYDAHGNLEADPEVLYGVRKEVANMLGKNAISANPTLQDAASQLGQVKDALDAAIEKGAPGYQQYLDNYAAASKPIDTMQYLQSFRPKIINSSGQMSIAQVHSMMKDVTAKMQQPGANPAKSIDPDTLSSLWNLHADMVRMTNRNLGKAAGSDTVQNVSVLGHIGGKVGTATAHAVAGHIAPGIGNLLVEGGKVALKNRAAAKAQARLAARTNELLYPSEVYGAVGQTKH